MKNKGNSHNDLALRWLEVQRMIKERFGKEHLPDLNAVLFLIGLQESGSLQTAFTKEEKQELMHVAVCHLLSLRGYYRFIGRDEDGWPHWELIKPVKEKGAQQEELLKALSIEYFQQKRIKQK